MFSLISSVISVLIIIVNILRYSLFGIVGDRKVDRTFVKSGSKLDVNRLAEINTCLMTDNFFQN